MTNEETQSRKDALELITFRVDGQEFCVDIMDVREIRGWTQSTPMPRAPAHVCGVINLRGTVLPVVDLACRLGLGSAAPSARHVIIVVHIGARLVGLLVEAVSDIITTSQMAMQPTPDLACEDVRKCVRGIFAIEGRMISWVTLDQILPQAEGDKV